MKSTHDNKKFCNENSRIELMYSLLSLMITLTDELSNQPQCMYTSVVPGDLGLLFSSDISATLLKTIYIQNQDFYKCLFNALSVILFPMMLRWPASFSHGWVDMPLCINRVGQMLNRRVSLTRLLMASFCSGSPKCRRTVSLFRVLVVFVLLVWVWAWWVALDFLADI